MPKSSENIDICHLSRCFCMLLIPLRGLPSQWKIAISGTEMSSEHSWCKTLGKPTKAHPRQSTVGRSGISGGSWEKYQDPRLLMNHVTSIPRQRNQWPASQCQPAVLMSDNHWQTQNGLGDGIYRATRSKGTSIWGKLQQGDVHSHAGYPTTAWRTPLQSQVIWLMARGISWVFPVQFLKIKTHPSHVQVFHLQVWQVHASKSHDMD